MFGFKYIKFPPTTYVIQYVGSRAKREGPGQDFWYYAPSSTLVAVPLASVDLPFIFTETTANFQEIIIQGHLTYRIAEPKKLSQLLNFTLNDLGKYVSEDPQKLRERILHIFQVVVKKQVGKLQLKELLGESTQLSEKFIEQIAANKELKSLGIEVLGVSVLAVSPNSETSRALEAETREEIFKEGDDALYNRRNASIAQERKIKENELQSEIATAQKQKGIREAELEIEKTVQTRRQQLAQDEVEFQIELEEKKHKLAELNARNKRIEADANAYQFKSVVEVIEKLDPNTIQALASFNMDPQQLIALSFQEIGKRADKIGQLNISPELLQSLTNQTTRKSSQK